MIRKPIKLSPKKGGRGYVTSYSVNIGCAEARACGLITDNSSPDIEKIIDPDHNRIIIQLKGGEHNV